MKYRKTHRRKAHGRKTRARKHQSRRRTHRGGNDCEHLRKEFEQIKRRGVEHVRTHTYESKLNAVQGILGQVEGQLQGIRTRYRSCHGLDEEIKKFIDNELVPAINAAHRR